MKLIKRTFITGLILCGLLIMIIAGCYIYVELVSKDCTYRSVDNIPNNRVGVVLGTSPISRYTHRRNPYYDYRIEAVVKLYQAGKNQRILVSGDNRYQSYNEPEYMKHDIMKSGIPEEHIYLDYAGFRTLDSIIRAKKVFGLNEFTIISQKFHNERAICIAKWQGILVTGFNARDISVKAGLKVHLRECLSRVKLVWDLVINQQPHFLGETIEII